ncbi:vacuolar protein sorting/targeting protein PEP1 [Actinomortierella ambigua]|uniref:Vacuolar protein sorting/targeting protein PEP1 n=1 Tax=Actinomortierella ambigua TaxID=1343610 RepID=A0A9P6PUN8_9FUNG|nr:vacuolar protein sorting/targeting protein PEP1 [Actinomortierella ambigua]
MTFSWSSHARSGSMAAEHIPAPRSSSLLRALGYVAASALALTALLSPSLTASAAPTMHQNGFQNAPLKLSYFEDSAVVLYHDRAHDLWRSPDEGRSWELVEGIPRERISRLVMHAFDKNTAYALTSENVHYKTTDKGISWTKFESLQPPVSDPYVLSFHAKRPNYVLMAVRVCDNAGRCHDDAYYTLDGFSTPAKRLMGHVHLCEWAMSSKAFDEVPEQLVHCLAYKVREEGVTSLEDVRLLKSQDFFKEGSYEEMLTEPDAAIINFITKESFMLAAQKHLKTGDMSLYVSEDARKWAKAHFPHGSSLREDSYTILESSPNRLVVDVKLSPDDSYGSLFFSNSNGTYFVESKKFTNRNKNDNVDFEKVQNIDGVYLINVVDNHDQNPRMEEEKKLRSQITFDAGATWQYLDPPARDVDGRDHDCRPNKDGSCSLHLHSVTSAKVAPPIFSSKAAPGIVMGVGNVGPHLLPWDRCDTYISEDGGITWKATLKHPHKYEFGDMGGIIVAVRDDGTATADVRYSSDRGRTWRTYQLENNIHLLALISDPESTTQRFMVFAEATDRDTRNSIYAYQFDLTTLFDRDCDRREDSDRSDYEKWYARNIGNRPDCLMGRKTYYWRRKADAQCLVNRDFEDPIKTDEDCPCDDEDFECDYNYVLRDGKCVLVGEEVIPAGECKKAGDKFLASSGWRKIPGNSCKAAGGKNKDEPVSKECKAASVPTDIQHKLTRFKAAAISNLKYFLESSVVLMLRDQGREVWRSVDDGSTWERILNEVDQFYGLYLHDVNNKMAYLVTNDHIYVTHDQAKNWEKRDLPAHPNKLDLPLVDFHPNSDKNDWMLFLGQKKNECFTTLYRTRDAGRSWKEVDQWVEKAVYAAHRYYEMPQDGIFATLWDSKLIPRIGVCQDELYTKKVAPLQFVYRVDAGESRRVYFQNVVDFYVVHNFLVVAVDNNGDFVLQVSMDGSTFHPAVFPPNMRVDKNGFTVLQSTTGGLVVDVAKSDVAGREYGLMFKSNSNGTFYSLQLENSNRNSRQLVDWEKIGGIEGVILANQVTNIHSLARDGEKYIQTRISFNDGGNWNPIPAPADSQCDGDECHLQLHSVTDYNGPGAVFSASSSVGIVMGVGNVGTRLLPYDQCQTYLSRDAGKTWKKVRDSFSLYEFGDEGGVLVTLDNRLPTHEVQYSYDFGSTWRTAYFSDKPIQVVAITTEPTSRTSKILIAGIAGGDGDGPEGVVSVLDFSDRPECVLDKKNAEKNDFEKWSPFATADDRCLLGQEITYWRRKPDRVCRVNDKDGIPDMEQATCTCTLKDYECDFGFFRDTSGNCRRFGYDPDRPKKCDGTYMGSSGLRKLKLSQCKGGKDYAADKVERQCGSVEGVVSKVTPFDGKYREGSFFYFPESDICMVHVDDQVYRSTNEGKDWESIKVEGDVIGLQRHPFDKTRAIITTNGRRHFYTRDRGSNWDPIDMPSAPNALGLTLWSFHPTERDWIIYVGDNGECSSIGRDGGCHAQSYFTRDDARSWQGLAKWVRSCSFARDTRFTLVPNEGIFCEQYADQTGSQKTAMSRRDPVQLIYTENWGSSGKVLFETTVGYAIYSDYMIVAEMYHGNAIVVSTSLDGKNFARVRYPANFDINHPAFTVLDSTTRSVFMSITTNDRSGSKFGNLFTSNSNGTFFSLSLRSINENDNGNVDFEKIQGLEGIALLNEVMNPNDANLGKKKELRTLITADNGRKWQPLNAPAHDKDGNKYDKCKDNKDCHLHLHNYLDRRHADDYFSSPTAPGMYLGVGNVGETLKPYQDGNTYITRDGGFSWTEVMKGPYMYDFGDQGSIILMAADDKEPTNILLYSLDHGLTFQQHQFANEKYQLNDIIAQPNGVGKSFMVFATPRSGSERLALISIDFEGLDMRPCVLDLKDEDHDDFERWSPAKLRGKSCVFGRKVEYFRRNPEAQCFVGEQLTNPHVIEEACDCTDDDFECDYNYEPNEKGECVLIKDAKPAIDYAKTTPAEICMTLPQGQDFYYESFGYRKMSISKCKGDHRLQGTKRMCPGAKSGGGGLGFFGWVAVLGASGGFAAGLLWCVGRYRGYQGLFGMGRRGSGSSGRRSGGAFSGFGRGGFIRLADDVIDQTSRAGASLRDSFSGRRGSTGSTGSGSGGRRRGWVPRVLGGVADVAYQVWNKLPVPERLIPSRFSNYFNQTRYQHLAQEPGELIMDDYFDHYLDDDDEDAENSGGHRAGGRSRAMDTLMGQEMDGMQDAQERYRDETEDEEESEQELEEDELV